MKRKDLERANEILKEIKQIENFMGEAREHWSGDVTIRARRWFNNRFNSEATVYQFGDDLKRELLQLLRKRLTTLHTELDGIGASND